MAAHDCVERTVSGVNAQGDHLLLTPGFPSQSSKLIYSAEYNEQAASEGNMILQACTPTNGAIDDGTTKFNLLVIDAK